MIAIIGGGISGLALAYQLQEKNIDYILLEESDMPGGIIRTDKIGNYILEKGPNTIMAENDLKDFIIKLGLKDEICYPAPSSKKRYIFKNGAYRALPGSPISLLFSKFFSWKAKWSFLKERNLKSRGMLNESLGGFFERRFNKEVVDYAVDPFITGIFAGDPYRLLVRNTFPFLQRMEEEYGSILKGFIKQKAGLVKKESLSFHGGLDRLIQTLASEIKNIRYQTRVVEIEKADKEWKLVLSTNGIINEIRADKIVLSTPAGAASEILKKAYSRVSSVLSAINYAPLVKIIVAFKRKHVKHSLNGYGGLNPKCENQFIIGTLWNSSWNPEVCPSDEVLLTSLVGGMSHPEYVSLSDAEILNKVVSDLKKYYGIKAEPCFEQVYRIPKSIPQYDQNTLPLDSIVQDLEKENIYVCASWYRGASISDCIKKAFKLSQRVN